MTKHGLLLLCSYLPAMKDDLGFSSSPSWPRHLAEACDSQWCLRYITGHSGKCDHHTQGVLVMWWVAQALDDFPFEMLDTDSYRENNNKKGFVDYWRKVGKCWRIISVRTRKSHRLSPLSHLTPNKNKRNFIFSLTICLFGVGYHRVISDVTLCIRSQVLLFVHHSYNYTNK